MQDITLKKYFGLSNRLPYDVLLRASKPKNLLGGSLMNANALTYKEVRMCLEYIRKGETIDELIDLFTLAFKIDKETLLACKVTEFFSAQSYLIETFTNLQKRESNLLSSIDADQDLWQMAGGDKLNKFSNLMPLVQLGEIYNVYPYDLENKPYSEILVLLVLHKEKSEVQKKYSELKNQLNQA